jgi:hypothetical protein
MSEKTEAGSRKYISKGKINVVLREHLFIIIKIMNKNALIYNETNSKGKPISYSN